MSIMSMTPNHAGNCRKGIPIDRPTWIVNVNRIIRGNEEPANPVAVERDAVLTRFASVVQQPVCVGRAVVDAGPPRLTLVVVATTAKSPIEFG